jgi:hypothetical protein
VEEGVYACFGQGVGWSDLEMDSGLVERLSLEWVKELMGVLAKVSTVRDTCRKLTACLCVRV